MGERKVLNRYIPPDFDPSIIPKFKRDKNKLIEVRMMLPFSMRCNTCGEYMYRGKKFNSKSEIVKDDNYMGIKKFRFYIKCTHCAAEITFKTDPKNSDYECESGASRNFELWRDNQQETEKEEKAREEEEEMDAMKALEHRTMDNKIEMDVLDALDEIKALKYRNEKVNTQKVLELLDKKHSSSIPEEKEVEEAEDLKVLQSIQQRKQGTANIPNSIAVTYSNITAVQNKPQSLMPQIQISRKRKIDQVTLSEKKQDLTATSTNKDSEGRNEKLEEIKVPVPQPTDNPLTNLLFDYGDEEEENEE